MRDEFKASVRREAAERVGLRCSNPGCLVTTLGPRLKSEGIVNIGVAAHIAAASPGGPRFDTRLTPAERRSAANAIWLCQTCAKMIDSDPGQFPIALLLRWKSDAELNTRLLLGRALGQAPHVNLSSAELEILRAASEEGEIWLIRTQQDDWVRSGNIDFQDPDDPAYSAEFLEALESLLKRHLVEYRSGILYNLTGRGFKLARALSEK